MYVIVRDADDYDYSGPRGNIINMRKRHCRIGKVTPKPPKHWDPLKHAKPTGYYPYTGTPHVKGLGVIESLRHSF